MKGARTIVPFLFAFFFFAGAAYSPAETQSTPKMVKAAKSTSEIHSRKDFDAYLAKFNSRDYEGFLAYFADKFEMIHVGANLKSREEVMRFYNFLHQYIKESVIVDRLVMDRDTIAMEARVKIEGIKKLTPLRMALSRSSGQAGISAKDRR